MTIAAFSPYAALRRDGALPCLDRAGSESGHAGGRVGVGGGVPRGLPREVLGQSPNMIQTSRLAIRPSRMLGGGVVSAADVRAQPWPTAPLGAH